MPSNHTIIDGTNPPPQRPLTEDQVVDRSEVEGVGEARREETTDHLPLGGNATITDFKRLTSAKHEAGHLTLLLSSGVRGRAWLQDTETSLGCCQALGVIPTQKLAAYSIAGIVGELIDDVGYDLYGILDEIDDGALSDSDLKDLPEGLTERYAAAEEAWEAIIANRAFFDWVVAELLENGNVTDWQATQAWRRLRSPANVTKAQSLSELVTLVAEEPTLENHDRFLVAFANSKVAVPIQQSIESVKAADGPDDRLTIPETQSDNNDRRLVVYCDAATMQAMCPDKVWVELASQVILENAQAKEMGIIVMNFLGSITIASISKGDVAYLLTRTREQIGA